MEQLKKQVGGLHVSFAVWAVSLFGQVLRLAVLVQLMSLSLLNYVIVNNCVSCISACITTCILGKIYKNS